jgi:hypothetical protein
MFIKCSSYCPQWPYLASGVVEPRYPRRKSPSRLDPFADTLSEWLASNARQGRKQRRTLLQMHASLREQLELPIAMQ